MSEKTVFISYRRDTPGRLFARLIKGALKSQGYDAFLDVDRLEPGEWAPQILAEVSKRAHFLLLLTPGALDHCVNEDDWVRQEFLKAVETKRNIVPVCEESVDLKELRKGCPESVRKLFNYEIPTIQHATSDNDVATLIQRYIPPDRAPPPYQATPAPAPQHTVSSAVPRTHTLPPLPSGFVGRDTDLLELRKASPASGAVITSLRGMGGIGKTALALVLAHEWKPRFPDAQLFLDARGTQADPPSARKLMEQVIQTFHPDAKLPDDNNAVKSIYHDVLHGKKVLILVDNARDTAQAAPLAVPAGCALIVTSRQSINIGSSKLHTVGRLPEDKAAELLREYYPALHDADAAELTQLCAGLPLALRLAGAHLKLDAAERGGAPAVADYIKKLRSGRLAALDADAPDANEITISETLRLSEEQLIPEERAAWRQLAVFSASFDARAAEAVAGATAAMSDKFVRRSLLEREGMDRFKLHDLAADYARAKLLREDLRDLHIAHARHYAAVGDEADRMYLQGNALGGLVLFDRERTQLEAAFAWLTRRAPASSLGSIDDSRETAGVLIALMTAVTYTGDLRFHPRQRIAWLEAQLAATRLMGHRQAEGATLGNLGLAHAALGDARKAIEFYEQRLAIAREIGDRRGEGNALGNLGNAHGDLGDAHKAIDFCEQQLVITREIGNRRSEGNALGNLGSAHAVLGDVHKAIDFYEQQLVIVREIGDRRGEGSALNNLGNAYATLGDSHKANELYEQRLIVAREIGDRRGESSVLGNLGIAHSNLGDARKAIEFYEQQLVITREIGDQRGEGTSLWNSALAWDRLGNRSEAITLAEAALRIRESIEDPNAGKVRATLARWRSEAASGPGETGAGT